MGPGSKLSLFLHNSLIPLSSDPGVAILGHRRAKGKPGCLELPQEKREKGVSCGSLKDPRVVGEEAGSDPFLESLAEKRGDMYLSRREVQPLHREDRPPGQPWQGRWGGRASLAEAGAP